MFLDSPISFFEKDKYLTVKKSNELIRSKYNLSLLEQRIILIGISYIKDKSNRNVYIPVSEYRNLLNVEHFNYQHLVDVLQKLRERSIVTAKVNSATGELEEGFITGWVDSVHYKDGVIQLRFNEDIWSHIIELKEKYAEFQLSSILTLKSKYSIRFYEILKSYAFIGHYTATVDEIRDILMLESKYSRFNDLDRTILSPSINEINENDNLDIKVTYTPEKKGRRYSSIKFHIFKKTTEFEDRNIPPEVAMARSMTASELFMSIKTILNIKYKCVFTSQDLGWQSSSQYTKYALESTYVSLVADEWEDHKITNHKSFFAEHLKRLSSV